MSNLTLPFPAAPADGNKTIIKPSKAFLKQVYRSAAAVGLFVLVYILLFLCCLAIAVAFCLLGYAIIAAGLGFFGGITGIGFILCGLLLVFFVIKFLFRRSDPDHSLKLEIKRADEPGLYEFIDKIAVEIGSHKPKRIFLTADVNASVAYSSSFWSMFLPVRKNLRIGLGLVNTVNISEFKAVIAHEFGHFSQRSMKFGSYVYNLNKVIYNLLFENSSYEKLLDRLSRLHAIFKLMAFININIIKGIQEILKKTYVVVNKTYLKLSREMEFHADMVAAYASGSNQTISMLKKIEIAQLYYTNLLEYLNLKLAENKRTPNFYREHRQILDFYSGKNEGAKEELIEIDDPWSSHPATEERLIRLRELNLNTITLADHAWSLFENSEEVQKKLTDLLYANAVYSDETVLIEEKDFESELDELENRQLYDAIYKNYYDRHEIDFFDVDELSSKPYVEGARTIVELIDDDSCKLPLKSSVLSQNITILNRINDEASGIKKFFYLSQQYDASDAPALLTQMEKDYEEKTELMRQLDTRLFLFFYNAFKTIELREELKIHYKRFFDYKDKSKKDIQWYNEMITAMKPVYGKMTRAEIKYTMDDIYYKEKKVKPRIKELIEDEFIKNVIVQSDLDDIKLYLKNQWHYYLRPAYDEYAISVFNKAMRAYISVSSTATLAAKGSLLKFQAQLLEQG